MNSITHDAAAPIATLPWRNGFARMGATFSTRLQPTPLPDPYWVGRCDAVAAEMGLPDGWLDSAAALEALAGNAVLPGSEPLASVYSGHQFGVWAGQLGDGRAILLGELDTPHGALELQLKGAGRTPYSRGGDGRAVLRSSIREFLCSEAMHGLGIPTTRALSVVGSDQGIRRETMETAAVVARVAPSFIRFGHFEHFAHSATDRSVELRTLADEVIDHHYPECRTSSRFDGNVYASFLEAVSERTARLLAQWQAAGFCHGVMNTDNMSILGLTIDYGPFQFLDGFDPAHVCNHSDTAGRYAFNQQPNVAYWNLHALAQALLPLIGDQDAAVAALASYKTVFPEAYDDRMREKLGLLAVSGATEHDGAERELIDGVLRLLAAERTDWTIFWRRLCDCAENGDTAPVRDLFIDRQGVDAWLPRWLERRNALASMLPMHRVNPKFVLRNHLGQQAIELAQQRDYTGVATLLNLLQTPFEEHAGHDTHAGFPPDWASTIEISCSS
ncbi:MAG: protein adenylyltransferase SelO [Janthinobacterium lividum]